MKTNKRHRWNKFEHYAVCQDCGGRYRLGNTLKIYEWRDGRASTTKAGICEPVRVKLRIRVNGLLHMELPSVTCPRDLLPEPRTVVARNFFSDCGAWVQLEVER